MNKKKKIVWGFLFFCELTVMIACFCFYKKSGRNAIMQASDFQSEGIYLENFLGTGMDGYYIDSSFPETQEFARSEGIVLGPGCYRVTMHYVSDEISQSYMLDGKDADFRLWLGNWHAGLPSQKKSYATQIWIGKVMEDFHVTYDYSGDGFILVGNVEVVEQKGWLIGLIVFLVFAFALLDGVVWKQEDIRRYFAKKEHRIVWLGCSFICFFVSIPLFAPTLFYGHDLQFHLLRIEGIKEGLLSGQFPVKIQPNWMNGYGYGTSLFYGDIFLYIPAVLRLCGFGVQSAYKAFVFMVNGATCLFSYYAFWRFTRDYRAGLLGSFLYTGSVYRLVCVYMRAAVGEYTAMTFLPLFFLGIYEMLFVDEESKSIGGWTLAALSYTGILHCHLITSEMAALFTMGIGLVFWRRMLKKERMIKILKCGVEIIFCSLGFIVPFLDMSRDSYWFNMEKTGSGMQTYGVAVNQLLNLFPNGAGEALSYTTIERIQANGEMPYAIGGGIWRL